MSICVSAHCLMLEVLRYIALNELNTVQKIKAMSKMSKIDKVHLTAVMLCMSKMLKIDQIHLRAVMLCMSCCILGQQTLVKYTQCRTNEDVRMYIEEYLF